MLLEDVYRLRRFMHMAAVDKVRRTEEEWGQLRDECAHRVYLNHMFVLERRCILTDDLDDLPTDMTTSPSFVPLAELMAPMP